MLRVGLVLAFLILFPLGTAAAAASQIVIQSAGLRPSVLEMHVGERVSFVNLTGRPVHVQFGHAPDRHEVFQVPGRIWATFFVTGRHPYVVHVTEGATVRAIEGAVQVSEDPDAHAGPPVCDGTTVFDQGRPEVCIER